MFDPTFALDELFPRPALVTLAGRPYQCGELTLGRLATLQSWLRMAAPHPTAGLAPDADRAALVSAWHAAKAWPPRIGSDDEAPYLATAEGRAVFLLACLADHNEDFTADEAKALAAEMSPADWAALRRVAWGVPPWRELAPRIDPAWAEDAASRPSEPPDWGEIVADAVAAGRDFADMESWTLSQLRAARSGGKADAYRAVRRSGESKEDFEARMMAAFSASPASA